MKSLIQSVKFSLILIASLLTFVFSVQADPDAVPVVNDLATVAAESRSSHSPILLVFTAEDCGYCERLKHQVIIPVLLQGELKEKVLVLEFDLSRGGKITDFDGERVRSRIFASRHKVFATPTVLFLDDKGNDLVAPIVGFSGEEDYLQRLEQSIQNAMTALSQIS